MDKGIYTALSGGLAKSHEIEVIANNLANANTPGFKRDSATFNEYLTEVRRPDLPSGVQREINQAALLDGRPQGDKSFVEMDGIYTMHGQGGLKRTNLPFDLGLEGKGFFEVLTPQGIRYTRQGNFNISKEGVLVTANGYPVLGAGEGGAPEQRQIRFGSGPVDISRSGEIRQKGQVIGQIAMAEFHENQWLEKVGNAYFRNTNDDNLMKNLPTSTQMHQGFIENSNVNAVHEMTRLIEATRAYESHMQAIKTYQEIDGRTANEIARR
jgi:flagellar basal-body rod protein FlgG